MEDLVRLNLGANDDARPGFLSVDRVPPADRIADLCEPWPWPQNSVEEIYAKDVFEHIGSGYRLKKTYRTIFEAGFSAGIKVLADVQLIPFNGIVHVMNEAHRVLRPGGRMELIVPCWPGKTPWCDPTHSSVWVSDFRYYFDERWNNDEGERGRLGPGMGITALWRTVGGRSGVDWTPIQYARDDKDRFKLFLILEAVK